MSRNEVYAALKSTGIPWAHVAWPYGQSPDLPFGLLIEEDPGFAADDSKYARSARYTAELYTKFYDPALAKAVEDAIAPWGNCSKTEAWIAEENCCVTYFEFTEIGD